MTVLSEDSDEASCHSHPRKKARLSRHVGASSCNYKVITSNPVYLNNYMDTDFYPGGVNGCNLGPPDSPSGGGVDDLYAPSPSSSTPTDLTPPIATLVNLGNTCFLNSVLYTLRFAPSFLHNLHHLVSDINTVYSHSKMVKGKSSSLSRLGSTVSNKMMWTREPTIIPEAKMQCTSQLHEVYEELRRNEVPSNSLPDPVHPTKFMQSLRAVNSMFEGNQQHDAHELYIFLLDNLRETSKDVFKMGAQYHLTPSPSPSHLHSPLSPGPSSHTHPPPIASPPPRETQSSTKKMHEKFKKSIKRFRGNNSSGPSSTGDSKKNLMTASTNSLNERAYYEKNGELLGAPSPADGAPCTLDINNITEDFEGVSIIRTICTECETVRERKEVFCDICVPIPKDSERLGTSHGEVNQLYRSGIVTEEMLIEANKYWCEECLRYNEAKRCYRFQTLPRLLTLHLKRFSSGFNSGVSKVSNFMPTPFRLECFCETCLTSESAAAADPSPPVAPPPPPPHSYDLYAVIMHLGSTIASGHYVSYVRARDSGGGSYSTTGGGGGGCTRERRTGAAGGASGGRHAASSLLSAEMEKSKSGILKFLRPSSKSSPSSNNSSDSLPPPLPSDPAAPTLFNKPCAPPPLPPPHCRASIECCGIRLSGRGGRSGGAAGAAAEEWLECDDENVRPLSQAQFEEMLVKRSPAQGTPYLLFYTRV